MNNTIIAPSYQMKLVDSIKKAIWDKYSSYRNVQFYIEKWHESDGSGFGYENFFIHSDEGKIDLLKTLHGVDGEILIKIAIDMGVETPDFIPAIPIFRNSIKQEHSTPSQTFEQAFNLIEEQPDTAIGLANSALEGIIKELISKECCTKVLDTKKTLYDLASDLLKELQLYPNIKMPIETKTIGSSLLKVCQMIEKLRSEKTNLHGKSGDEVVIDDPMFTYYIVNAISTVGLFLMTYFKRYNGEMEHTETIDYSDDIPF